ncbi:MAG: hypothetical protein K6C10_04145 [Prevotella sp.]|nr:hypothetical protein [Prevotella sp.]
MQKYYEIVSRGDDVIGGVLYSPSQWPYPIARDGEKVKNWENLELELRYGKYRDFHLCTGGANVVSESFMNALLPFVKDCSYLEFLPVLAKSTQYGDQQYYIMHFKKVFDVINMKKTMFVEGTDSIIKLVLDREKVKDLPIFNSQPAVNDVIISNDIRKVLIKKHLVLGTDFIPISAE